MQHFQYGSRPTDHMMEVPSLLHARRGSRLPVDSLYAQELLLAWLQNVCVSEMLDQKYVLEALEDVLCKYLRNSDPAVTYVLSDKHALTCAISGLLVNCWFAGIDFASLKRASDTLLGFYRLLLVVERERFLSATLVDSAMLEDFGERP